MSPIVLEKPNRSKQVAGLAFALPDEPQFNARTIAALEEGERLKDVPPYNKTYATVQELFDELSVELEADIAAGRDDYDV